MFRLAPIVLLVACAHKRDAAPDDVDGLSRWTFQHFEDPDALTEGIGKLAVWLDGEGRTDAASDGYVLSDFTEEEVADVVHPDLDLAALIGVAVPGVSAFPVDDHAALVVQADQTFNDPSTYAVYTRSFVEGDPDAFLAGTGVLRTVNDIDKKGAFGVDVPYTLNKDFQWVDLGDQGRIIVARSWIEQASCSPNGSNCLNQSFSIDLWYGANDTDTVRMTAGWNDLVTQADSVLTDEGRIGLMVSGVHDIFRKTDETIAAEQAQ